jgi:hypothetical protein
MGSTTKCDGRGNVALGPKFKFALGQTKIQGGTAGQNGNKCFQTLSAETLNTELQLLEFEEL